MAQDQALDDALATGDAASSLEPLRDRLGDAAATVIDGHGPLAMRVAAARGTMHAARRHEAAAIAKRVRLMLAMVTLLATGFGIALLGLAARPAA